jgi:predicted nucleic-acid-binding Zn-ribbon protein
MAYDYREVENALRSRGIGPECPSCGEPEPNWDQKAVLTLGDNREHNVGSKGFPQVAVTCPVCGYTRLYNAKILGLHHVEGIDAQ